MPVVISLENGVEVSFLSSYMYIEMYELQEGPIVNQQNKICKLKMILFTL